MKNKQLLDGALASIKTVRKNLGGVTMIGQSADDLGSNADSIVNSCTSFLFLKDATFNRKRYAELFKMNEQQLALFESLQDREGLYMRRDGLTKVVTLNLDSRSYATFSTRAQGPCTPDEADRTGTDSLRAFPALPRARLCNPHHHFTTRGPTMKPPMILTVTSFLSLACGVAQASPATPPHRLEPNAPRSVTVSEAQTPPVIRAGLLQSTLILLPAEEKIATVFGGDTVDWVFDGGPCSQPLHQRQAKAREHNH